MIQIIETEQCNFFKLNFVLKSYFYCFSIRFGGRVPRSGSEQQLPRAETHSDFGRHSLLRSSLKASAAAGAGGEFCVFIVVRSKDIVYKKIGSTST